MSCPEFERLTARQKECLRLLHARYEPKQIASELGISYDRVHQHFKAARERLGVQRSIEAARLLCEFETFQASQSMVSHENGLPDDTQDGTIRLTNSHGKVANSHVVNGSSGRPAGVLPPEAQSAPILLWPFPTAGRPTNELNWWQRLLAGLLIAFVSIAIVGAMKALQN